MARLAGIASVGLRVLGAVCGGYALTALAVTAAGAVMARLGLARSEAVVLASMAGFLIYLGLLLWAFSVKSVARLWKQYTVSGSAPSPPVSPSLHPTIATASFAMPAMRLFK